MGNKHPFAIQTRQKADLLFSTKSPLLSGGVVTSPVRRVRGYAVVNFLAISNVAFTLTVEEASDPAGPWAVTLTQPSAADTMGNQVVCEQLSPCGSFMRASITNGGVNQNELSFTALGLPIAGGGSGGGGSGASGFSGFSGFSGQPGGTSGFSGFSGFSGNSSGGALVFVDSIEVVGAPVTSVSFAGLDGDNDFYYEIIANIVGDAGIIVNSNISLEPNGDATGTGSFIQQTGAVISSGQLANMLLLGNVPVSGFAFIKLEFYAAREPGLERHGFATSTYFDGGTFIQFRNIFRTANAANITSMNLVAASANGFGVGSKFFLYKRLRA